LLDKQALNEVMRQIAPGLKESSRGYNFRCVLCGDSKKSRSKRRGWVLFGDDSATYYCHNCGASLSLKAFLKENYPEHYKKLFGLKHLRPMASTSGLIKLAVPKPDRVDATEEFVKDSFPVFEHQESVERMTLQHAAITLLMKRKIPEKYYSTWRICDSGDYRNRLLIPFLDTEGRVYCYQGRDLTGKHTDDFKYLTYKPKENHKIFNYYLVDSSKDVFILEGPIDAMFIDNAIATSGITRWETAMYETVAKKFPRRVWVFDNDKAGKKEASIFARNYERVFVWPKDTKVKDINDIILERGLTKAELLSIITTNTYTGIQAVMKLKT